MALQANANSGNSSKWARYANPVNWFKKIWGFIIDSKNEMKKITWPEKSKVYRSTGVVIASVVLIALFIWFVDSLFNRGLGYFLQLVK
ncbi:MAG TPA: preprotein translocase subunit SecE [Clostridiaceae bacterium]|nr:preprotein translocase subunit SecE [Clostridiaceae bacterium]